MQPFLASRSCTYELAIQEGGTVKDDEHADFVEWVAVNRSRMRRSAFLLCGDWYLADDLVQDMLGRVYSRWSRVAREGDPSAFARRVMLNLFLDHRRKPLRREQSHARVPETPIVSDLGASVDERDALVRALRLVAPGQRAVLVLRFWEDLSIEQTADELGRSVGHVKSQSHRGLATLRTALADLEEPSPPALKETRK